MIGDCYRQKTTTSGAVVGEKPAAIESAAFINAPLQRDQATGGQPNRAPTPSSLVPSLLSLAAAFLINNSKTSSTTSLKELNTSAYVELIVVIRVLLENKT